MSLVNYDFPTTARIELHKLKQLPSIPAEMQKLLQVVRDEQVTLDQLYLAVENSPTLTARLLGLANSAYFGQAGAVHTIKQAIYQVLGLNTVKSLVYTQLLSQTLNTSQCAAFSGEQFWSESLLRASFAQKLVGQSSARTEVDEGVAYTTGLLVNLGLLALVHTFPAEMDDILRDAERKNVRLSHHLREQLGIDQYRAGAWLASRWHFPDALCQTILAMSGVSADNATALLSIMRLSHGLAQQCYRGVGDVHVLSGQATALGLNEACLQRVLKSVAAKKQELTETARLLGNVS